MSIVISTPSGMLCANRWPNTHKYYTRRRCPAYVVVRSFFYCTLTLLKRDRSDLCVRSAPVRGGQSALDSQTGRGRRAQGPAEGVRRTPSLAARAVRRSAGRRQAARLDRPPQLHHGHGALHRIARRREYTKLYFNFFPARGGGGPKGPLSPPPTPLGIFRNHWWFLLTDY